MEKKTQKNKISPNSSQGILWLLKNILLRSELYFVSGSSQWLFLLILILLFNIISIGASYGYMEL